jgi:hypothetical protein
VSKLAIALILLLPAAAWADFMPILDFNGGGTAVVPLAGAVGGWQFQVTNSITISALGLWDEGSRPLAISHQVGLWTLGGTLLATASVSNASTPAGSASPGGRWLFTAIAPLALTPGDYVLGAVWGDPVTGADPFRIDTDTPLTSGIAFSGGRSQTLLANSVLVFPSGGPGGNGVFGPNAAVDIPEPGSALLLLTGLGLWAGFRRPRV